MRRLLPPDRFLPWFGRFLPRLADGHPAVLFRPAAVTDRSDGKIAHLDGLNLSRAWCFRALAGALPAGDARATPMRDAVERHLDASLPHVAGDYMGSTGLRASRCWRWRGEGGLRPGGAACQPKLVAGLGGGQVLSRARGGAAHGRRVRAERAAPDRQVRPRTTAPANRAADAATRTVEIMQTAGPSWTMATIRIRSSHIAQPAFDGA